MSENLKEKENLIVESKKIILTGGDQVNTALNQNLKIKEEIIDSSYLEISKEIIDIGADSKSVKVKSNREKEGSITALADIVPTELTVGRGASDRIVLLVSNESRDRYGVQTNDNLANISGRDKLRVIPSGRLVKTGARVVRHWATGEGIRRSEDWSLTGAVTDSVERQISKGTDDTVIEMEQSEEQDRGIERRQEAAWEKMANFRRRQLMKDRRELRTRALEEYINRLPDER